MKSEKFYRVNDKIRFSPVVVVDSDGKNLGQLSLLRAKEIALSQGLDLVEVSPSARPPVCKIMDFGKFKFDQEIKEKKQRQLHKQTQIKEIRLSCNIADHDIETKYKSALKFLENKNKVQLRLEFKRRDHHELGHIVINKFLQMIADHCVVSKKPSIDGRCLFCLLEPKNK